MKLTPNAQKTVAAMAQLCVQNSANPWAFYLDGVEYSWVHTKTFPGCTAEIRINRWEDGRPRFAGLFQIKPSGSVVNIYGICPLSWTNPAQRIEELKAVLFYTDADGQVAGDMGEDANLWAEYEALTGSKPYSTFWA